MFNLFRAQASMTGDVIVCAASGNESGRNKDPGHEEFSASLPAAAFGAVSVGTMAEGETAIAPLSNTDPTLSAPGVDVLSARAGGGLMSLNGTSMACPHLACLTALRRQAVRARNLSITGGEASPRGCAPPRRPTSLPREPTSPTAA